MLRKTYTFYLIAVATLTLAAHLNADEVCYATKRGNSSGDVLGLISCIQKANRNSGIIIELGNLTYMLNTPYGLTLFSANGPSGLPPINSEMTIQNGIISRNPNSQFQFRLLMVGNGVLNLQNVALLYGADATGSPSGGGGAIYITNGGLLESVDNCTFQNNSALANQGQGGAIAAQAACSPNQVVINSITDSTFSNNKAHGNGGAIAVGSTTSNPCTVNLIANATFSENSAASMGGAILLATATINHFVNSTVSGNSISGNTYGGTCGGGGLALTNAGSGASVINNLQSTIVSGNSLPGSCSGAIGGQDICDNLANSQCNGGSIAAESYNLIGSNQGNDLTAGISIDTFNGNKSYIGSQTVGYQLAHLGPLGKNGGPTQTMALLSNSAAVGSGTNPFGFKYDQRGFPFGRANTQGLVDIGAYQSQLSTSP